MIRRTKKLRNKITQPARPLIFLALISVGILGCATNSTPDYPQAATGPNGYIGAGITGENIVVRTEDLMGPQFSNSESDEAASAGSEVEQSEPASSAVGEVDTTYRIGPGDTLQFRSFDDETLNSSLVVRYDGYASFQVIPDLKVEGFTRTEVEDLLVEEYSQFYVDPNLTLSIIDTSSKFVNVLGEVQAPGAYPYPRPLNLIEAITAAGGMRVNQQGGDSFVGGTGQLVKATIIRPNGFEREILEFDLSGYNREGHTSAFTPVLPGDTIYVPESQNLVYLIGEVTRPSVYAISEGLTLIKLLAQAGGFTQYTARLRQVIITREINETETQMMTFDVKENLAHGTDMLLRPGDVIYLPKKKMVNLTEFIQRNTAAASASMSFANQVMGLYQNAYQTYYTKDRYDLLYNSNNNAPVVSPIFIPDANQPATLLNVKLSR
jgi:polysaccharide export outer membrane protein